VVLQDMGAFAGALCLLEMLKLVAKSFYNTKVYGKRQQEASLAAAQYVDADLELEDRAGDAW